jgi:hypothetical protein
MAILDENNKYGIEHKYVKLLRTCTHQCEHEDADSIICDLLEELDLCEIADAYRDVPKWFS